MARTWVVAASPGRCRWPGWCACKPGAGVTCSTGCASTAGARASAARCPKPTTPGLIAAAHKELHAPVVLIWDNLNTHISAAMGRFVSSHPDWLTEVRLPAYAPDLNPAEGAWANMKNGLGNLAARDVDQLAAIVKNRLKRIQYRPALIDGFLAQTGLTLEPQPP